MLARAWLPAGNRKDLGEARVGSLPPPISRDSARFVQFVPAIDARRQQHPFRLVAAGGSDHPDALDQPGAHRARAACSEKYLELARARRRNDRLRSDAKRRGVGIAGPSAALPGARQRFAADPAGFVVEETQREPHQSFNLAPVLVPADQLILDSGGLAGGGGVWRDPEIQRLRRDREPHGLIALVEPPLILSPCRVCALEAQRVFVASRRKRLDDHLRRSTRRGYDRGQQRTPANREGCSERPEGGSRKWHER